MAFVRSSGWWGGNPQGQRAGNRLVSAGEDPRNKDRRLRREKADREARIQAAKDLIGMGGLVQVLLHSKPCQRQKFRLLLLSHKLMKLLNQDQLKLLVLLEALW